MTNIATDNPFATMPKDHGINVCFGAGVDSTAMNQSGAK